MIIPVGFGQVNFIFTGAAVPTGAQITMGFEHQGSDLNSSEAAELFENAYVPTILTRQVDSLTLDSIKVKYGPNDLGQESTRSVALAGGSAGDEHAPQVAMLVRKVTEAGGRANRGRFYLPGLNESQVDLGGFLDASEQAAMQTEVEDFFGIVVAAGCTFMVLHGPDSPVVDPTEVTSFSVDGRAATQRRRLRR